MSQGDPSPLAPSMPSSDGCSRCVHGTPGYPECTVMAGTTALPLWPGSLVPWWPGGLALQLRGHGGASPTHLQYSLSCVFMHAAIVLLSGVHSMKWDGVEG